MDSQYTLILTIFMLTDILSVVESQHWVTTDRLNNINTYNFFIPYEFMVLHLEAPLLEAP